MPQRALVRILLNLMLALACAGLAAAQPAHDDITDAAVAKGASAPIPGRAMVVPNPPVAGETVTVRYDRTGGPLEGQNSINLWWGYNNWSQPAELVPMTQETETGFFAVDVSLPEQATQLDFVFNNGAGTWDNNDTRDWHFTVLTGESATIAAVKAATVGTVLQNVQGIVTSVGGTAGRSQFSIQDATGGLLIDRGTLAAGSYAMPSLGDAVVIASGTRSDFNGTIQFLPTTASAVIVISSGNPRPEPVEYSAIEFLTADRIAIQGLRIRLKDVTFTNAPSPFWGAGNQNFVATDLSDNTVTVRLSTDLGPDAAIWASKLTPVNFQDRVDVIGVGAQFGGVNQLYLNTPAGTTAMLDEGGPITESQGPEPTPVPGVTFTTVPEQVAARSPITLRYNPTGRALAGAPDVSARWSYNDWSVRAAETPMVWNAAQGVWTAEIFVPGEATGDRGLAVLFFTSAGAIDSGTGEGFFVEVAAPLPPPDHPGGADPYANHVVDYYIPGGHAWRQPDALLGPLQRESVGGAPTALSMGGPGSYVVVDMGRDGTVVDGPGADLRVWELANMNLPVQVGVAAGQLYEVWLASDDSLEFAKVLDAQASVEIDLADTPLANARYVMLRDVDELDLDHPTTPGSDIAALEALHRGLPAPATALTAELDGFNVRLTWADPNPAETLSQSIFISSASGAHSHRPDFVVPSGETSLTYSRGLVQFPNLYFVLTRTTVEGESGFSNETQLSAPLLHPGVATAQPAPMVAGEQGRITYDPAGSALEPASQVFIHLGYNRWQTIVTPDPAMTSMGNGKWYFDLVVPIDANEVNVVFNNGADTWDNNNQMDWHFAVGRPFNDNFGDAIEVTGTAGEVAGFNVGATIEGDEPIHTGAVYYDSTSVWYTWAASATGLVDFDTCTDTDFDSVIAVYVGDSLTNLLKVVDNDDACGIRSRVTFEAFAGNRYQIVVDGADSRVGNFLLRWAYREPAEQRFKQQLGLGEGPLALQVSPGGERFYAACSRGVIAWDMQTGEALRIYPGHDGSVRGIALSADGNVLATASDDRTARLWDVVSGAEIQRFIGHTQPVTSIAISPDGRTVLTGSMDATARLWNVQTGENLAIMTAHIAAVVAVAFSPDGSRLVTGGYEKAILWDATGTLIRPFDTGFFGGAFAVAFSPDGRRVATGGLYNYIWDVETGDILTTLGGYDPAFAVGFSGDANTLVTANETGGIQLWNASTGAFIRRLVGHTRLANHAVFVPGNQQLLTGAADLSVRRWNFNTGQQLQVYTGYSRWVEALAVSPDGTRVATASGVATASLWDTETGQELLTFEGHTHDLTRVAYAPNGETIATTSLDGTARIWNTQTGALIRILTGHLDQVYDVAYSSDGTRLATCSRDQTVRVWSASTGATLQILPDHGNPVNTLAWSPNDQLLATGDSQGTLRVFDVETATLQDTYEGHEGAIRRVAFSPDGTLLLTGALDQIAIIRDAQSGDVTHTLRGHTDGIMDVAFSHDGTRVLTAAGASTSFITEGFGDNTTRIWDVQTGAQLRILGGHHALARAARFTPDSTGVVTGGADGAALLWELAPPRAIVVAGGGPYAGNSIARQTHELGVYTYRTLLARGYAPEDVLYLSAFPEGTAFPGGSVVSWDIDGDGLDDVDGLATREALEAALAGDFAQEAGRLLVLMMDHGYRTGDTVAFRLNPTEAVTTMQMNAMLDGLQNAAAVDVTLVVDCCYSGQFAVDCAKSPAIPSARERIVIASTSPTTEAVFLPAPDLTSFMYTFLSSAYMGNSMGEAFRSGARFFRYFPVAGQSPRIHDGERLYTDDEVFDSPANKRFFGATWAYGVQADKNINQFFPAFASVEPAGTVAPGEPITLRATMLPFQSPERVTVAILPPAPTVLSGEPIVGLPRAELVRIGDDRAAGEVWEITLAPGDPAFPFSEEGAYRATFTAQFGFNRNSDPERTGFTVTSGPDPDATSIRAVLAFGTSIHAPTEESLDGAAKYAYAVYLDRYQDPNGDRRADWIDVYTGAPLKYAKDTTRRIEQRAAEALVYTKTGAPTTSAILASIATRGAEAGRLVVHLAGDDASDGTLRFSNGQTLTATQLDDALDAITSEEIIVIIDAPGSGSFLAPLAATGDQQRVVLTSGRAGDCAIFLADPAITYTHKLLAPLWGGVSFDAAHRSADGFFRSFVGEFAGTRIAPQLDDNGDGVYTFADGQLAARLYMGRRYAFAGDEASGLPFIIESEVIPPAAPGLAATLRVRLLEGIEPATDTTADPLDAARVYAQFTPPGVLCGEGATTLPRFRLRREGATAWTWSAPIAPAFLEGLGTGQHPVMFYAEYPDGSTTKMSEPVLRNLALSIETRPEVWTSY